MARKLMIQGTGSNVGKSIIVAGLCRALKQQGFKVTPFKAQNMALNSYVTFDGGEIGRAQALQAEAAGILPRVEMNPILLKPSGNMQSQVIVLGKPIGNMSANEYHMNWSKQAWDYVIEAYEKLDAEFDVIVIEGAGSPAELNLRDTEIVNMRMAKYANSPVLLVGDIDRGGVLASLIGTMALFEPEEAELVKGFIINKFRGDINLFLPAVEILKEKTGLPTIGIIPYHKLALDEEDSMSIQSKIANEPGVDVVVIRLPQISNFTDFDALKFEPDVSVRFEYDPGLCGKPDVIIIPGSKNTFTDLDFIRKSGWEKVLFEAAVKGKAIVGICGGYQMLGEWIYDPYAVEGNISMERGLGFFKMETEFTNKKTTILNSGTIISIEPNFHIEGYEIHMGQTKVDTKEKPFIKLNDGRTDGVISENGQIWGTYFHGIFDNDFFRRHWLDQIRVKKGLLPKKTVKNYKQWREENLNKLCELIKNNLDMEYIFKLLENN